MNYNKHFRTDIVCKNCLSKNTIIKEKKINNFTYRTIFFNNLNIKKELKKEIIYFFNKLNIKKGNHILIVGLGNDNNTADSIGPKTIKYLKINSFLETFNIKVNDTVTSSLEPGVLGETGIESFKIIKSVCKEIKPDLVILIDSIVSDNILDLNKTIQITDAGINPGFGFFGFTSQISKKTLNVPTITIGVTTAIEVKFDNIKIPYFLSSKDIDDYILKMSKIIAFSINEAINDLK